MGMVNSIMSMTTQVLIKRLEATSWKQLLLPGTPHLTPTGGVDARNDAVDTFVEIFASAIRNDLRPILLRGLELARNFPALKAAHQEGRLSPEVSYELEAIWPTPVVAKRARLS